MEDILGYLQNDPLTAETPDWNATLCISEQWDVYILWRLMNWWKKKIEKKRKIWVFFNPLNLLLAFQTFRLTKLKMNLRKEKEKSHRWVRSACVHCWISRECQLLSSRCSSTRAAHPQRAQVLLHWRLTSQRGGHHWHQWPAQQPELSWAWNCKTSLTTGGYGAEVIYMMRRGGGWWRGSGEICRAATMWRGNIAANEAACYGGPDNKMGPVMWRIARWGAALQKC